MHASHRGLSGEPLLLLVAPQALRLASTKRPVARVPGIGVYFNELLIGVRGSTVVDATDCSTPLACLLNGWQIGEGVCSH